MKSIKRARQHGSARANPGHHPRALLELELLEDRTLLANAIVTENQLPGNPASE